ncbi:RusA family crossover junction endodeoxyribonuclease, partial [Pseudomonas aeruginosa]|uniref:RusA family crossover junction endodeoxyribonuclease n=1 Tax=Pseudomonas aeruginosa TaxID=287 RepID=UPI001E3FD64A
MHDLRPVMFTVPGEPVGKGRPRIGRVGAQARMFTPAKTANYEGLIAHSGQQAMAGRALFEGPVLVELDIALSIPQSMSKKRKALALSGQLHPTADSTPSGHPVRSHLARHSTATWPPVPRPSGRAVGAQRRRGC